MGDGEGGKRGEGGGRWGGRVVRRTGVRDKFFLKVLCSYVVSFPPSLPPVHTTTGVDERDQST